MSEEERSGDADAGAFLTDNAAPGYLFHCNNATEQECLARNLFGDTPGNLTRLQEGIGGSTVLFLFNLESRRLRGPFRATAPPARDICPTAWDGKFGAQVRVAPKPGADDLVLQRDIKIMRGPKSATEVSQLLEWLRVDDGGPAMGGREATGAGKRLKRSPPVQPRSGSPPSQHRFKQAPKEMNQGGAGSGAGGVVMVGSPAFVQAMAARQARFK
jgi:hypothetical protein